jgi:hypothetical protein
MTQLTGEILGVYEAEQQHALEARMQRGMNIQSHWDEVTSLMRIVDANRRAEEMRARMEQEADARQPRVIRGRPFQVWVRGFASTKLCLVHTVEELYEQAAQRFQAERGFIPQRGGKDITELEDDMTVDMMGALRGGGKIMVNFRIECGTREWGEQLIEGEKVGEWRKRAITLLNAREQEHAQCVCLDGALLDEEDEASDWMHQGTVVTLQREMEQDKSWRDDEEAVPPERMAWSPMTQEEIREKLQKFTNEDQHSDDEMIKRRVQKPASPSVDHRSLIANSQRCADIPRCSSALGERPPKSSHPAQSQQAPAPKDGAPASRSRADAGPSHQSAEATQRAPASRTVSGQAGPRTKESTHKRAELDACDPREAQGAVRARVLHNATPRKT